MDSTFLGRRDGGVGGQHFTPKFIIIFFCDISLLISTNNRQVSHF